MKISIVMAYHNRRQLLYTTLQTIAKSKHSDVEVIVVDDASKEEERVESLCLEFPFLQVLRIEEPKRHVNPCIPYNKAIANATGDIIIIQNPECLHVHDILAHAAQHINDDLIISYSAYAIDAESTSVIQEFVSENVFELYFRTLPQRYFMRGMGWYNHSTWRPVYYHFCLALSKTNMKKLGGFDERFADGYCFDDDEFVTRIKRLKSAFIIEDNLSVIHQWHGKTKIPNQARLWAKNKELYEQVSKEVTIKTKNRYEN